MLRSLWCAAQMGHLLLGTPESLLVLHFWRFGEMSLEWGLIFYHHPYNWGPNSIFPAILVTFGPVPTPPTHPHTTRGGWAMKIIQHLNKRPVGLLSFVNCPPVVASFLTQRQLSINAGWQHMGRVPHPNYVDPECCVATVCHQVRFMYWEQLGHFQRAISHLNTQHSVA